MAQAISLRGAGSDAEVIQPTDLLSRDIPVVECGGAELGILEETKVSPRAVVVETHGMLDAPEATVRDRPDEAGYEVINSSVAEERLRDVC